MPPFRRSRRFDFADELKVRPVTPVTLPGDALFTRAWQWQMRFYES